MESDGEEVGGEDSVGGRCAEGSEQEARGRVRKKEPFKRGQSGATSRGKRHHFPRRPPGSPERRSRDLENLRENGAACITSSRCYISDMYTPSPASRGDGSARARITLYYVYDKRELRLVTFRGVRYSR